MWNFFYFLPWSRVNRGGSPLFATTGITVSTTDVRFALPSFRVVGKGTMYINISQVIPDGTTATLPIVFTANGATQAATKYNGEALTVADLQGTGVYEFYFDTQAATLQLIGTAPAAAAATQG